jgi:hypothetical protein
VHARGLADDLIPRGVKVPQVVPAPGAILDLNGRTITVRNASGSGFVRNGTLVVTGVDSRMSPATVIIMR